MNLITLLGRLGHDPSLKETAGGTQVVEFSLCTNHKKKVGDEWEEVPTWHRVKVFGNRANVVKTYLSKGDQLLVSGRQENRKYEDKEGVTKWASEVIANDFHFVGGAKSKESEAETQTSAVPNHAPQFDQNEQVPF